MAAKQQVKAIFHSAGAGLLSLFRGRAFPYFAPIMLTLLAAGMACTPAASRHAQLEDAYAHFAGMRYDQALPLVKDYLVHVPHDPSAHWLLGACYRNLTPPWLTVAEGEFRTAQELFEATGWRGALARFTDDSSLEFELHRGRALAGMQWILEAMDRGLRARYIHDLAEQALGHVERARALAPGDEELAEMEATLREIAGMDAPRTVRGQDIETFSV